MTSSRTDRPAELRVVATAGHVDHGKSSLIARLTGIDPDRWAEEKRRGLTIDLGYAWCTLPSGREVGFVDVPGHERFIGNMLAGVGPVRLVLFVVAADEGWKPQSEEHLQILDVLGVDGGVIALTKRDLVDPEMLAIAEEEIRDRVAKTPLEHAPVIAISSSTGEGVDELRTALDTILASASLPPDARARLFVDRVFTIKGAGTVVTGTLGGGCLAVGDEVELYPTGMRARIRSLQTHKKAEQRACPVSRVAANLAGTERDDLERGDVLAPPGAWRATSELEALVRPVRGLADPITARGAYKLHAGAAEVDATLRFYLTSALEPGGEAFGRIRMSRPLVLDVFDRFVLREVGRRETVAGGVVLDVAPPRKAGADAAARLSRRRGASRDELPELIVAERGAVSVEESMVLTGSSAPGGLEIGGWLVDPAVRDAVERVLRDHLSAFHHDHPLEQGEGLQPVRTVVAKALRSAGATADPELVDSLLADLMARGVVARDATTLRLESHRVELDTRAADIERLLAAIGGDHEATPPGVGELLARGFAREVIDAAAHAGLVIRVSAELVVTPALVSRAHEVLARAGEAGTTVSAFREALGTTRKYAVPILAWFDQTGVTRRDGDVRVLRRA